MGRGDAIVMLLLPKALRAGVAHGAGDLKPASRTQLKKHSSTTVAFKTNRGFHKPPDNPLNKTPSKMSDLKQ